MLMKNMPEGTPIAQDPHHNGCFEWAYHERSFWQRQSAIAPWVKIKRIHLTAKRAEMFYHLTR